MERDVKWKEDIFSGFLCTDHQTPWNQVKTLLKQWYVYQGIPKNHLCSTFSNIYSTCTTTPMAWNKVIYCTTKNITLNAKAPSVYNTSNSISFFQWMAGGLLSREQIMTDNKEQGVNRKRVGCMPKWGIENMNGKVQVCPR